MKGIILAGGSGSRLYPITLVTSKQLLPIYDKPMIYYPLSSLMLAGIRDILIITTQQDKSKFEKLLGDGSSFGINLSYETQEKPRGLAEAFIIGESYIGNDGCVLILGDNIFYGNGFVDILNEAYDLAEKGTASIFGYYVNDPKNFGVVEFDQKGRVLSVEEKPDIPKSNYAITGLYFYPPGVSEYAKKISPSKRGELEITSLNEIYLNKGKLNVHFLGRGFAWLDTGTIENLVEAANFVKIIEDRQGIKISAPEEIAYRYSWINSKELLHSAKKYGNSPYGKHLRRVAEDKIFSTIKE
jgi:glucose-1-phosphate thymidylyltransferase